MSFKRFAEPPFYRKILKIFLVIKSFKQKKCKSKNVILVSKKLIMIIKSEKTKVKFDKKVKESKKGIHMKKNISVLPLHR